MTRLAAGVRTGLRAAFGLLVDDGAVAVGILLAVGVAALLSATALLRADAVGWVLFALVWVALAVSLHRARAKRHAREAADEPRDSA